MVLTASQRLNRAISANSLANPSSQTYEQIQQQQQVEQQNRQIQQQQQAEQDAYNKALKIVKRGESSDYIMQGSRSKSYNEKHPEQFQERKLILKYIKQLTGETRKGLTNRQSIAIAEKEQEEKTKLAQDYTRSKSQQSLSYEKPKIAFQNVFTGELVSSISRPSPLYKAVYINSQGVKLPESQQKFIALNTKGQPVNDLSLSKEQIISLNEQLRTIPTKGEKISNFVPEKINQGMLLVQKKIYEPLLEKKIANPNIDKKNKEAFEKQLKQSKSLSSQGIVNPTISIGSRLGQLASLFTATGEVVWGLQLLADGGVIARGYLDKIKNDAETQGVINYPLSKIYGGTNVLTNEGKIAYNYVYNQLKSPNLYNDVRTIIAKSPERVSKFFINNAKVVDNYLFNKDLAKKYDDKQNELNKLLEEAKSLPQTEQSKEYLNYLNKQNLQLQSEKETLSYGINIGGGRLININTLEISAIVGALAYAGIKGSKLISEARTKAIEQKSYNDALAKYNELINLRKNDVRPKRVLGVGIEITPNFKDTIISEIPTNFGNVNVAREVNQKNKIIKIFSGTDVINSKIPILDKSVSSSGRNIWYTYEKEKTKYNNFVNVLFETPNKKRYVISFSSLSDSPLSKYTKGDMFNIIKRGSNYRKAITGGENGLYQTQVFKLVNKVNPVKSDIYLTKLKTKGVKTYYETRKPSKYSSYLTNKEDIVKYSPRVERGFIITSPKGKSVKGNIKGYVTPKGELAKPDFKAEEYWFGKDLADKMKREYYSKHNTSYKANIKGVRNIKILEKEIDKGNIRRIIPKEEIREIEEITKEQAKVQSELMPDIRKNYPKTYQHSYNGLSLLARSKDTTKVVGKVVQVNKESLERIKKIINNNKLAELTKKNLILNEDKIIKNNVITANNLIQETKSNINELANGLFNNIKSTSSSIYAINKLDNPITQNSKVILESRINSLENNYKQDISQIQKVNESYKDVVDSLNKLHNSEKSSLSLLKSYLPISKSINSIAVINSEKIKELQKELERQSNRYKQIQKEYNVSKQATYLRDNIRSKLNYLTKLKIKIPKIIIPKNKKDEEALLKSKAIIKVDGYYTQVRINKVWKTISTIVSLQQAERIGIIATEYTLLQSWRVINSGKKIYIESKEAESKGINNLLNNYYKGKQGAFIEKNKSKINTQQEKMLLKEARIKSRRTL